jgi:hypothetical protein
VSPSTAQCVNGGTQCLITLASGQNSPNSIAVDSTKVYWTTHDGNVMKVPLGGGDSTTLVSGQEYPGSIAVDSTSVYWTTLGVSSGTGTVMKAPLGGAGADAGDLTVIASGETGPANVTLDSTYIYWNFSMSGIMKLGLDGGPVIPVDGGDGGPATPTDISVASNFTGGIAVDSTYAYFTNNSGGPIGAVDRVPKVGIEPTVDGGRQIALASNQENPAAIAIDSVNVYWLSTGTEANDYTDGALLSVPIGGGTVTTLASGLDQPWGLAVDSTNLYWTNVASSGSVMSVPIGGDGGTVTTLASGLGEPTAITVDSTSVYWVDNMSGTVVQLTPK